MYGLSSFHKNFKIKRIVSTYQSVTGTGKAELTNLIMKKIVSAKILPHPSKCTPAMRYFLENGYTKEEMKLVNETHKILSDKSIKFPRQP